MKKKIEKNEDKVAANEQAVNKRTYLKQSDVPAASLDDALRIPQAILDHYAGKPISPLYLAKALNVDPKGSQFKVLSGAAIAFGLIEGGAQAASVTISNLARNILRPKEEGADLAAKREAILKPRVFGDFLRNYDGHPFPRKDIGLNVLEEMGVPRDKTAEVLERIETSANSVGLLQIIKDKTYVSLETIGSLSKSYDNSEVFSPANDEGVDFTIPTAQHDFTEQTPQSLPRKSQSSLATAIKDDERRRRVFITHGKNRDLVSPIKKLLEYGELIPVVSVDRQSVSKPVPEKVMDDMRACGAAIIHVDADAAIIDEKGGEHVFLNSNVLIEIGAAMAFYGRRFILLVRDGVKLPSNLQGLYEVRYAGDVLDADATIKLLEAIKDIKNYELPTDEKSNDELE